MLLATLSRRGMRFCRNLPLTQGELRFGIASGDHYMPLLILQLAWSFRGLQVLQKH